MPNGVHFFFAGGSLFGRSLRNWLFRVGRRLLGGFFGDRFGFGGRLEVGGPTPDGRVEVVLRGRDEQMLAGELAGLVEWVEVTGPPGVRDHLAAIGRTLAERYS